MATAMQSLHLVVGLALGLCWFTLPVVDGSIYFTPEQQQAIVDAHNNHRREVYPPASNMQRLYWSDELARIAAEHAHECTFEHNRRRHRLNKKSRFTGENIGISFERDITDLIHYWFYEGKNYEYNLRKCTPDYYTYTCDNYLQMVYATACEVGCALAECPYLPPKDVAYFQSFAMDKNGLDVENSDTFLVVCNYGPGLSENNIYKLRPYYQGRPCSRCPEEYSSCDDGAVGGQQGPRPDSGLCFNEAEMCMGSDPHFAIRLTGGDLLCYSFQGIHNATFNLVSNSQLQMNALFVPDETNWDNTWLGSIGITVYHNGNKTTTLQFTATNQLIRIGERIQMDAKAIKKLTFHNGKLTMLEVPSNHTPRYPRVQVQFIESELNFTIGFAKNGHLDLYWHSTGVPYEDSRGIVGQFFSHGVSVDINSQLLHVPGRPSVPVEKQELWKFMEQSFHSDTECWTSAYPSNQGAVIVAGSYKDYIVNGLLATGL